ncbi:MAG: OB-fold domain-containing protein [Myxococcota bacterium]
MAEDARTTAAVDERSVPFFEAAERGVLALQRCEACRTFLHPVRGRCTACGDPRVAWVESSGRGRVFGHGKLRRSYLPEHEGKLPLALVWVELDERVRFASRLATGADGAVRTGDRVAVVFERLADGTPVPVFRREV